MERLGAQPVDVTRFGSITKFIEEYADQYRFDWSMIAAQGYQESKLDQSKRSAAGAKGVIQVMPSTAADPQIGIPDIHRADPSSTDEDDRNDAGCPKTRDEANEKRFDGARDRSKISKNRLRNSNRPEDV